MVDESDERVVPFKRPMGRDDVLANSDVVTVDFSIECAQHLSVFGQLPIRRAIRHLQEIVRVLEEVAKDYETPVEEDHE